jgi:hypothetical protein
MQSIKSIMLTYPDFRSLPKGIKRMLVTSESVFFGDAKTALNGRGELVHGRVQAPTRSIWKN